MFVAISSHEEKSIVLPDGNVALQRDRLTVKPRYRPALAIIAPPISGMFRFVLHFLLLDWLFTDGRCKTSLHNRILRRTLPCANFAPRLRALHCNCVVCVYMEFGRFMADQNRRMAEKNWLCSDKLSTHFLYLISSSAYLLAFHRQYGGSGGLSLGNHHHQYIEPRWASSPPCTHTHWYNIS